MHCRAGLLSEGQSRWRTHSDPALITIHGCALGESCPIQLMSGPCVRLSTPSKQQPVRCTQLVCPTFGNPPFLAPAGPCSPQPPWLHVPHTLTSPSPCTRLRLAVLMITSWGSVSGLVLRWGMVTWGAMALARDSSLALRAAAASAAASCA